MTKRTPWQPGDRNWLGAAACLASAAAVVAVVWLLVAR
jgi:hypothetical protein